MPFVIFIIAGTAELNRPPFDLVEAEQELVGGFHTEYSSFRFAMFFLAEFMNTVTMSAIIVTLFFGGPSGPDLRHHRLGVGLRAARSSGSSPSCSSSCSCSCGSVPRCPGFRYDQLMDLGWKFLIPLALGWFLVADRGAGSAVDEGWNVAADRAPVWPARRPGRSAAGLLMLVHPHRPRPSARRPRRRGSQLMGYLDGFGVTVQEVGRHPDRLRAAASPLQYPEETRPKPERFHGRHVLNRYEDGMEKCIGCELCAGVCPARCIYVRGADNDPDDPTSPGERFGFVYEINYLRCIHCDLCVEACPTEAITETKLFEFAFTNRADAIYTKDELLVDDDGRPQAAAVGELGGRLRPRGRHLRLDAGHRAQRRRRLRGHRGLGRRARLRRARPRGRPAPGSAAAEAERPTAHDDHGHGGGH